MWHGKQMPLATEEEDPQLFQSQEEFHLTHTAGLLERPPHQSPLLLEALHSLSKTQILVLLPRISSYEPGVS